MIMMMMMMSGIVVSELAVISCFIMRKKTQCR